MNKDIFIMILLKIWDKNTHYSNPSTHVFVVIKTWDNSTYCSNSSTHVFIVVETGHMCVYSGNPRITWEKIPLFFSVLTPLLCKIEYSESHKQNLACNLSFHFVSFFFLHWFLALVTNVRHPQVFKSVGIISSLLLANSLKGNNKFLLMCNLEKRSLADRRSNIQRNFSVIFVQQEIAYKIMVTTK